MKASPETYAIFAAYALGWKLHMTSLSRRSVNHIFEWHDHNNIAISHQSANGPISPSYRLVQRFSELQVPFARFCARARLRPTWSREAGHIRLTLTPEFGEPITSQLHTNAANAMIEALGKAAHCVPDTFQEACNILRQVNYTAG